MGTKPSLAWIEYDPKTLKERKSRGKDSKQRKLVRSHVASTSAGTRKATLARKEALRKDSGSGESDIASDQQRDQIPDNVLTLLLKFQSTNASMNAGMAQKTNRTLLWTAFTGNNTCFQAALFVAGTFANTCGIPFTALHTGFGSGLLFLRGASLNAIQAAVIETPNDDLNSVSIALLAGWERRFGDQESYRAHIQAWKALPLSDGALDTGSIATLADFTLESFREAAQDLSLRDTGDFVGRSPTGRTLFPPGLPPGFCVIPPNRPEAISLLRLVAMIAQSDPAAPGAVQTIRRYCLENISWSPSHSVGVEPVNSYEEAWDQKDLNALYHVRSAFISINGILIEAALAAHQDQWSFDIQAGLDIHAEACQHLGSRALMGTRYQDIAIWAKFTMSVVASKSERGNEMLQSLLGRAGIETWEQLKGLLQRHVYLERWIGDRYRLLYEEITGQGTVQG